MSPTGAVFLCFGVVCGFVCRSIAISKNRDSHGWFWLGFFFSLIALLFVFVLPDLWPYEPPPAAAQLAGAQLAGEGWYPDPEGEGLRWWDGEQWTGALRS